ncbi:hypothetical protein ADL04_00455 [Streptomyces sp. NRRL B-3648]|nr:hypothetical protein ADL04_00455 [Streptomyces sp. NRRL B-3648]
MTERNPWRPTRRGLTDTLLAALAPVAACSLALGGLPYAEAAEVSDRLIGTVRSRMARARATLMDLLDEADEPTVLAA